mgnify:CR=1 FL=1
MKKMFSIFVVIVLPLVMSISASAKFQTVPLYYGIGKNATCKLSGNLTSPVFTASMEAGATNGQYVGDHYNIRMDANCYDAYMGRYISKPNGGGFSVSQYDYDFFINIDLPPNTAYNKYVWCSVNAEYTAYDNLNPNMYPSSLYLNDGF